MANAALSFPPDKLRMCLTGLLFSTYLALPFLLPGASILKIQQRLRERSRYQGSVIVGVFHCFGQNSRGHGLSPVVGHQEQRRLLSARQRQCDRDEPLACFRVTRTLCDNLDPTLVVSTKLTQRGFEPCKGLVVPSIQRSLNNQASNGV